MAPSIDPAIIEALALDPRVTTVANHGGSGFSTTLKITSEVNGEEKLYFVKTGNGQDAGIMFAATDFLDLRSRSSAAGTGLSFASKLAQLHKTPAPVPSGFTTPQFGFPVPTCCGSTEQPNDYSSSWADFFANQRLRAIMKASEKSNGTDAALKSLVEKTVENVVPRLLGDGHLGGKNGIEPVVVHGDLWSGNHGTGSIGKGGVEEVVFDPSSCYGHSEYELGIMKMFGGFGGKLMKEYHERKPKDHPVEEYDDRVALYEAYHYLNHHTIFGGGYKSSAVAILRGLNEKYGA
ncbi:MAG: hypothetical protein M1818_004031 [Claussenomyces sp. TS43310]|nr:MAG: hypothetical protein M1818_004031 [Claussenomyces sp. TS43310]